jgi:TolB-like protein
MPSIHPNYEYDIFISYRQNDNQNGWVTNFVKELQKELKSTLKNEVSIYFDENPHDGLLEIHQVDASLAKKLKCLIFLPIISQTYCDETSFAWQHEFMPFIEMAKKDELGINVTLSNGNVASRILPVKIHDLDPDDQNTLAAVLDGPLRSIDFIYKEPGVNRPLNPDDSEEKNLNQTRYKNQINKVSNALKDIGQSVIKQSSDKINVPASTVEEQPEIKSSNKTGIYLALTTLVIALLMYWGYKQFFYSPAPDVKDVTIAVLAFDDQSPNGDQEWLGDGMADEILNVLAKVEGLQVTGKTSSFSFKAKGLTTKVIGETLNVKTVLEGSVSKIGDKLRITAQLIDVETDAHIWSKKYDRDAADIFNIIDEVSQNIAGALRSELSIKDVSQIKMAYRPPPDAYEYFIKAEHIHDSFFASSILGNIDLFMRAKEMYHKAISIDPEYMDALAGLANLYDTRGRRGATRDSDFFMRDSIIQVAYKKDPSSPYVLYLKGLLSDDLDSAFNFLKRGYEIDPHNKAMTLIGSTYFIRGLCNSCISFSKQYLATDPLNVSLNTFYLICLYRLGQLEEARALINKMLEYDGDNYNIDRILFDINIIDRDTTSATKLLKKLYQLQQDSMANSRRRSLIFAIQGKKEEALKGNTSLRVHIILGMNREALQQMDSLINGLTIPFTGNYSYLSLKGNPDFDGIREEPQFKQWLEEAKVVYEERVAKYGHLFDD